MVDEDGVSSASSGLATVVCGDSHSVAISAEGELYAWGKAYAGRCGIQDVSCMPTDDDIPYQPTPRHVSSRDLAGQWVAGVAGGRWHNLAVTEDGVLFTWGAADTGRCGHEDTSDMPVDADSWPYQPVPRRVCCSALEGRRVAAIACGENHSLVVTSDGALLAWGSLHLGRCGFSDTLGLPTDDEGHPYQPVPRQVVSGDLAGRRVASVACGTFHSLAVSDSGELFAWGSACAGRCGFADIGGLAVDADGIPFQPVPRQVVDGQIRSHAIATVACSEGHSFAVAVDGELLAWGNADAGRCGLGDVDDLPMDPDGPFQPVPTLVAGLRGPRVRLVVCGCWHSLAITQDMELFAWGAARAGRCGFADISTLPCDDNGPYQPVPRRVCDGGLRDKRVAVVACGSWHSLAATDEGELFAWGVALMSRCGFDTTGMPMDDQCPYQPTPLAVAAMPKVSISSGLCTKPRGAEAVCADLRRLLQEESYADVVFEVEGEEIRAHVAILAARSEHFRCMFRSGMAESRVHVVSGCVGSVDGTVSTHIRRVKITDAGALAFKLLLEWLYAGSFEPGLPTDELMSVLRLADVYRMPQLRVECERLLLPHITLESVLRLLQAGVVAHATQLEASCLRFVVQNVSAVRRHPSYTECQSAEVIHKVAEAWAGELEFVREQQCM